MKTHREEIQERVAIMQAWLDGKRIQTRTFGSWDNNNVSEPNFSLAITYRVHPDDLEPVLTKPEVDCDRRAPDPSREALVEALRQAKQFLPPVLFGEKSNLPESVKMQFQTSLGKLKSLRKAITKAEKALEDAK